MNKIQLSLPATIEQKIRMILNVGTSPIWETLTTPLQDTTVRELHCFTCSSAAEYISIEIYDII